VKYDPHILEMINAKHERQKPFGRPRHSGKNNVKMDLIEIGGVKVWTRFIWLWAEPNGGFL
jgi:hypothetical protein